PRPSEEDLIKKYLYLGQNPDSIHEPTENRESDNKRSEELYLYLKPYIKSRARILDFGGGNGRLMSVFIEKKHQCSLIDYCDKPIEGISRLGETLEEINTGNKFDIIICSHVLEHLADPMLTLKKL
ncbi:MAG TPA: hypothetical protein DCZ48_06975, partial [Methylococcaceae bacterium]|nr:hypothetical protein [Methylococcaceae bacterium]